MRAELSQRLVPAELWKVVAPLLPSFVVRPQGGGTGDCTWRHPPPAFGTPHATAHGRLTV
ncbi:hypothetical protein ABZ379_23450 [Streptomyces canus]|uniref:hypothetical protein n=1 Tax=Streptomyces canus TaxID=58343 RepID=UPI0033D909FF